MTQMDAIEMGNGDGARAYVGPGAEKVTDDSHAHCTARAVRQSAALSLATQRLQLLAAALGFFGSGMLAHQLLQDQAGIELVAAVGKGIGKR